MESRRHRRLCKFYQKIFILLILFHFRLPFSVGDTTDIYPNQPRIVTKDGHLLFITSNDRNITFQSKGFGKVRVNDEDLGEILISAKLSVAQLQLIKNEELPTMRQNFQLLQTQIAGLSQLETRIDDINNSVRLQLRGQVNSSRLTNMNNRQNRMNRQLNRMKTRLDNVVNLLQKDECASGPCQHGATCHDGYNRYSCTCTTNWEGPTCSADVNECERYTGTTMGCQNGATCLNTFGGFSCQCAPGFFGILCTERHDECSSASNEALCSHGTCISRQGSQSGQPGFTCICNEGWSIGSGGGRACNVDVDECAPGRRPPCSTNPPVRCINLPGTFTCGPCPNGYSGDGFICEDINECQWNNGGCSMSPMVQCINTLGSRQCGPCPSGYQGNGETCNYVGVCRINNGGCHPLATCFENIGISSGYRECRCPPGYQGSGIGASGCIYNQGPNQPTAISPMGNPCDPNPCIRGTCIAFGTYSYRCNCPLGYTGQNCEIDNDECQSQPCTNGGTCVDETNGYHCNCPVAYTGERCQEMRDNCGGRLAGDNGTLTYPLEQMQVYPHNRSCAWLITTPQTQKVLNLTFDRFNLELSHDCQMDFLQINDGSTASAHSFGRFCGSEKPRGGSLVTTHNTVYLWFYADSSVARDGFTIRWNTVEPECGGVIEDTRGFGTIKSPGYPGRYPVNRDCVWLVKASPGKRIQFAFATLQMEHHPNCRYDFLEIRDGLRDTDPLLVKHCSSVAIPPPPLLSSGPNVRLYFHSDYSNNDIGFVITYHTVQGIPGCGGLLTGERGSISSPDHPNNYENGMECDWLIRVHPNERVRLVFTNMDLEFHHNNCQYDFVEVFDGGDDSAATFSRHCGRNLPPTVISTSNTVFVKFRTDSSVTSTGFRATYEIVCGGILDGNSGLLHSPYYPDAYPASRECIYLIRASPAKAINLWFEAFDIEGPSCVYDYLEIRDGDTSDSPLLGKFCGRDIPEAIVSTNNMLWVKFKTDSSVQNRGFLANYTTIDLGCGGIYHNQTTGVITSPSHPEEYLHNMTCKWIVRAPPGNMVRITFSNFALESHWRCDFDYVAVYDNVTEENSLRRMGKFCGFRIPPTLTSSDNLVLIIFRSDLSLARDGFSLTFTTLDASTSCGGDYFTSVGVIRSPNYPNGYRHGSQCTWTIKVPNGQQIRLNVTSFDLELHSNCNYDFLEIRNGGHMTSPLIGKYCGQTIPNDIITHSHLLWMQFVSDNSQSAPGFEISWDSALTGCGGEMLSSEGTFSSPNYPSTCGYGTTCQWRISVSKGNKIRMVLSDLDIPTSRNCSMGLKLYNGRSNRAPLLASYCGTHIPDPLSTPSNEVFVEFQCPFSFSNQRGFQMSYATDCNNVELKGRRGILETPNFPQPYPHNRNCTWTIEASVGNTVNVSFTMLRLEHARDCRYDFVQLSNARNGSSIGRYCSSYNAPPNIIPTGINKIRINFVSDYSYAENGFSLEWITSGCGGDLLKSEGTFSSPNYPSPYNPRVTCDWNIEVAMGHGIELTIYEYDLESGGPNCYHDSITVFSGRDSNGILLNKMCERRSTPIIITSSGNQMYVRFISDYSQQGRGFNASYVTRPEGCGGVSTAPQGVLHTRNYPNPYPTTDDCRWAIKVAEGHTIGMQITDIDIPNGVNCSNGYLSIYDAENDSLIEPIVTKCDNIPFNVTTTGNLAFIRFRGGSQTSGKGFLLKYFTGCGAMLTAGNEESEITTMDTSVATYRNCTWTIRAKDLDDRVSLTFTAIEAPPQPSYTCQRNNVAVYDGDTNSSVLIQRLCTNQLPATITSRGDTLKVIASSTWHSKVIKFRAIYHQTSAACGGELEALTGSFASPYYPDSYPLNTECEWILKASVGNKISVSFSSFVLEQTDFCNGDYVEIRENDAAGRFIGRICGSDSDDLIIFNQTAANRLWVKFRSDEQGTAAGFLATFNIMPNIQLEGMSGEISNPLFPRPIRNSRQMSWSITVPLPYQVEISFAQMQLHSYNSRYYRGSCTSQLQIFNGLDSRGVQLGRYCEPTLPDPIVSTGNTVYLTFSGRSDSYGSRFLLRWNATRQQSNEMEPVMNERPWPTTSNVSGCSGTIVLNDTSPVRHIVSPGNNRGYHPNLRCEWAVVSSPTTHLVFQWLKLNIEDYYDCLVDYVEIWTSTLSPFTSAPSYTKFGRYCTRSEESKPPTQLWSNAMLIRFVSDSSVNGTGFALSVTAVCGGNVSAPNGVIQSPSYPSNYPPEARCNWAISVRPGRTIMVEIEDFNLEGDSPSCTSDYLTLRNGINADSPILGNGKYCGSSTPQQLPQTSTNHLFVQFVSNSLYSYKGFKMSFSEVNVECGGVHILNEEDVFHIKSPNYPSPYPPQTNCHWRIVGPIRRRLKIDFEDTFDIPFQSRYNCEKDHVTIYNGGTEHSVSLGQYCGHDLPPTLLTTSNLMYIVFSSQDAHPSIGFKAKISVGDCGGTVISSLGSIGSPNYPHGYRANLNCEWILRGPAGHFYIFNFIDLQTSRQNTDNCLQADTIQIRDYNSSGPLLGEFCGQSSSGVVRSADNIVYIRFRSLAASSLPGFVLNYNISSDECGGEFSTPTGVFTSPNYPRLFPRHRRCQWVINAPEGRKVRLRFTHFNMDRAEGGCMNWVAVFNSPYREYSSIMPYRLCGSTIPEVFTSSSNYMRITFNAFGDASGTGFRAEYDTSLDWDCGGDLSPESGTVMSPGFESGNYSHGLLCKWRINNPNTTTTYIINIHHLHLENPVYNYCPFDALEVRRGIDSNGLLMLSLCGNITSPRVYFVPQNQLFLLLESDHSIAHSGFNLTYRATDCGGEIGESGGTIQSPLYPSNYGNDVHCSWAIQLNEGQQTRIVFDDFQLELSENCSKDYVLVRNALHLEAPIIGRYCGSTLPREISTQGHLAIIEFHSDNVNTAKGFKIIVTPTANGCGGVFHGESGQLSSVNFPNDYPNNIECDWLLEGENGFYFTFTFVDRFDIETSTNCDNDFIEGFDYHNQYWITQGRRCGTVVPPSYNSISNRFRLLFRSNNQITGDGFKINWIQSCGGRFEDQDGSFTSPGYPEEYKNSLNCTYLIIPPAGHYIVVAFDNYFQLEDETNCNFDAVTVYAGNSTKDPVLRKTCGATPPAPVSRQGPILINFRTDSSRVLAGFKVVYNVSECGGVLTGNGSSISAPSISNEYHTRMNCTWLIVGDPNKIVEIKFQMFGLESSYMCTFDSVAIYDGNVINDTNLVGRPQQGCGGYFNTSSGTIESLDRDRNGEYESGLICDWVISSNVLTTIQLTFSRFDIEKPSDRSDCPWDYLEIRDGMTPTSMLIGRFCGSQPPTSLTSSGSTVFIRFVSDYVTNKAGFTLNFQEQTPICSGIINETSVIKSPNYPQNYPVNQRCRWIFHRSVNEYMYLKFDDFQLESSANCQKDYLSISSLYGLDSTQLSIANGETQIPTLKYCGSTIPPQLLVVPPFTINFASDGDGVAKGFSLQYIEPPCNANHTASHGTFSLKLPSHESVGTQNCIHVITTSFGRTISVSFAYLNLQYRDNCENMYLEVRDGGNATSPLLAKLCINAYPNPIYTSSSNQMWIKLYRSSQLDEYSTPTYVALYTTTDKGPGCGGKLLIYTDVDLVSPGYPLNHPVNDVCRWDISVPANFNIQGFFQRFDVGPIGNCTSNFIQLYSGITEDSDMLISTICPGDNPARVEIPSSSMIIKYSTSVDNTGTGFRLRIRTAERPDNRFGETLVPQVERQVHT
ncbi:hypothetical protein CHUAL_010385 [Chamberlinius hualienensis]